MATDDLLKSLLGEGKKKETDFLHILRVVWRKKLYILIPLALSWIVSAVGLQFIPETYQVGSTVAIESSANFTRSLEQILDEQAGRRPQEDNELNRVRAQIYNQDFLDGVITMLSLEKTPEIRERAQRLIAGPLSGEELEEVVRRLVAAEIRKRLDVRMSNQGLYAIVVEDHDPTTAYLLNRAITYRYVDSRREYELAEATAKGDFSDEQVAIYREKLSRAESELERFQQSQQETEARGNPVDANNVVLAEEILGSYREELQKLEDEIEGYRSRLRGLYDFIPTNAELAEDRNLRALENKQIHTMLQNLVQYIRGGAVRPDESLTERIEDSSVGRDRQDYQNRLAERAAQLYPAQPAAAQRLIVGYYYRLMLASSFQELLDTLGRHIGNFRQNVSGRPAIDAELARRNAEVTKYRELLDTFQTQSSSAQITLAMQASELATRIEVRDQPERPVRPVRPNKVNMQIAFVVVGLLAGVAVVLLTELTNRAFSNVDDIEKVLGLPVLGTIPPMGRGLGRSKLESRKNLLLWVLAMGIFTVLLAGAMALLATKEARIELRADAQAVEERMP